jgi:hypothetical protein
MPPGTDIVSADLGWAIPTGKFGALDTGLSLTGIAASALKGTTSLLQRKGYRAEMEIWRPATVSLCAVHASNLPLNDEAVSHLSAMVEKHSEPNTKTLGGMITLSSLTYLQQWLEFQNGGRFVALAITMLVMYKPADAAEMILSMYRAADRKEDLPSYGALKMVMEVTESDAVISHLRDDYSTHMDTVTHDISECEPANLNSGLLFVLAKATYFLHQNNDALVTIRARSTIPCILYTLSKLFGITFSFDPTQLQYTSVCGKYIIKASDEGSTSFQIWTTLNEPGITYSNPDIISPASQSVDLAQIINSSFCGPEIIKENVILAVNANFIQVFKSMRVAWYENLDADTPRQFCLPDPDSNVTLSKLFASDDSFGETYSKMKAEWDLDISVVAMNSADGLGQDDMFSVERFLPKGTLERLKRSCSCSDCSCGSNNASAEDCMTRAVFHWTIRRTMAMIATLFFVGKTPFRVFNRLDVDVLHLSDACRRMSIALCGVAASSLSLVNSHVTSRIERADVVAVQCLKEMALRLLTGDRNADVGLDFQTSALMRTIRGKTTYEAWIASGGLDMRRLLGYDVFSGAIHVDNIGTVPSLHPSDWNSVQKSFLGDLTTVLETDGISRPQSITSFVPLASIQDGECAASFKFVRGSQIAVIRARNIRRLPAHLVFERHHEHKCARAWEGEKWWDGISDPPIRSRCVSKTYGDTIARLCAATIAVERASFLSSSVVVQGSGCLKCAMHHASPVDLVIT